MKKQTRRAGRRSRRRVRWRDAGEQSVPEIEGKTMVPKAEGAEDEKEEEEEEEEEEFTCWGQWSQSMKVCNPSLCAR